MACWQQSGEHSPEQSSAGSAGFLYSLLIGLLMAVFGVLWGAVRREPDPPEEVIHVAARSGKACIVFAVLCSGIIGLVTKWYLGLAIAVLLAILIALYAAARGWHLGKRPR